MGTTKKIRVVFYARVSTEHEAQINAFENQIDWYKAELTRHPEWEWVDIYSDKGITGTSAEKRPGFMQMYADAHLGRFDKIVTRELSRFARNVEEAYEYARKFARHGVSILFLNDGIDTANAGDMTLRYATIAGLAQEESRKVSTRAKDGQKISMAKGVYYGNGNILGYDRYESKAPGERYKTVEYKLNEEQADTVRMIYDMYLSGMGLSLIKDELERRGRRTAKGKPNWHESNISKVLKNSFYYGTLTYHKEYVKDYLDQKRCKNYGEIKFQYAEGRHTPIVTKEEFDRVQNIMATRSVPFQQSRKGKKQAIDEWAKLLKCSCGCNVTRAHYSGAGENKKVAYQCYDVARNGTPENRKKKGLPHEGYCNSQFVQRWKLEFMANHLFKDFLPEKEAVVDLASQMLANYLESAGEDTDTKAALAKKEAELNALAQRKQRNMNFLLDGTLDAVMFKQNEAQISADIEAAQEEITALRKELTENNTQEVLEERIQRLKALLADYVSVDSDEDIIPELVVTAFVKQIIVFDDHFEWYLRTDASNQPIACRVKGRVNTDKVFTLSDSIYPYCIPQDRPLLKVDGSFLNFETTIGFDKAYQFQKEHGHVLRKSRWKDITARVMIDIG